MSYVELVADLLVEEGVHRAAWACTKSGENHATQLLRTCFSAGLGVPPEPTCPKAPPRARSGTAQVSAQGVDQRAAARANAPTDPLWEDRK
jgi:hypothetical protein